MLAADENLEHEHRTISNELILTAKLLLFPVQICLHRLIFESGISQPPWGCCWLLWVWCRSGHETSLSSYFSRNPKRMGLFSSRNWCLISNYWRLFIQLFLIEKFAFSSINREERTAVKTLEPAAEIHLSSLREHRLMVWTLKGHTRATGSKNLGHESVNAPGWSLTVSTGIISQEDAGFKLYQQFITRLCCQMQME